MLMITALGCAASVETQNGEVAVIDAGVSILGVGQVTFPLVRGTEICPLLACASFRANCPADPDELRECYTITASGNGAMSGTCLQAIDPGVASFHFAPRPSCPAADAGYDPAADDLVFEVLRGEDVDIYPVTLEESGIVVDEVGDPLPAAGLVPASGPTRVVTGAPFAFYLLAQERGGLRRPVGFEYRDLDAIVTRLEDGSLPQVSIGATRIEVEYEPGDAAPVTLSAMLDGAEFPVAEILPVNDVAIGSIEVVVGYIQHPLQEDVIIPAGARAVVRDHSGRLLFGTPVIWTVEEGTLAKNPSIGQLPGGDYVQITDSCVPPSENAGKHHAEVRATYGAFTDTAAVDWIVPADPTGGASDAEWEVSEFCVSNEPAPPLDYGFTDHPQDTHRPPEDPKGVLRLFGGECACAQGGGAPAGGESGGAAPPCGSCSRPPQPSAREREAVEGAAVGDVRDRVLADPTAPWSIDGMKLFAAVPVPVDPRVLDPVLARLQAGPGRYAWCDPRDHHLTAAFYGESTEAERRAIEARLVRVARETAPIDLVLGRVGAFDTLDDPRVLWVGVDRGADALGALADALGRTEDRPYVPHLTLARRRGDRTDDGMPGRIRAEPSLEHRVRAATVGLFTNRPDGEQPRYEAVLEVPLTG